MTNLIGRKFKIVKMMEQDPDASYGAKIGDIIIVSKPPNGNWPGTVWASRKDNPDIFTQKEFLNCENLCLASDIFEFNEHYEEVV